MGVLEEFEGVIGAIERALEVAEHDVHPARAVGFGGVAAAAGVVVQAPRRARMHAQMARQLQPGDVGLGVRQHIQGEKPRRQRQTAVLEQRAGHKAGLMPTGVALPQPSPGALESTARRGGAARTDETLRSARPVQRSRASCLRAVLLQEGRQRRPQEVPVGQTGLELHTIHRHDHVSRGCMETHHAGSTSHRSRRWLRYGANQGPGIDRLSRRAEQLRQKQKKGKIVCPST